MIGSKHRNKHATGPEELYYRLSRIYVASKHTEDVLMKSQRFEDGDTLAVWISDSGLSSKETQVTFGELYEILCDMAGAAKLMANGEAGP